MTHETIDVFVEDLRKRLHRAADANSPIDLEMSRPAIEFENDLGTEVRYAPGQRVTIVLRFLEKA